jgi:hypothetical protein
MRIGLAARNVDKLAALAAETGGFPCLRREPAR